LYEGSFLSESKDRATGFGKPRFNVTAWNVPLLPGKYSFQQTARIQGHREMLQSETRPYKKLSELAKFTIVRWRGF
jgi:hypothetical protein